MKKTGVWMLASLSVLLLPIVAFAAPGDFGEINTFATKVINFINGTLIPLLFGVALIVFMWGIFKFFILGGADDDKRKEGKNLMLWSIIGFVLMLSIFGIVTMISSGLGFEGGESKLQTPKIPGIEGS